MNGAIKVAVGAAAGVVLAKFAKPFITPHTGFLGSYNDDVVTATVAALVAVGVSKVL